MRPGPEFRHGPQVLLLQGGQPFESDPKEVSVQMLDYAWSGLLYIDATNAGFRGRIPYVKSPLLQKVGITLRYGQDCIDRLFVKGHSEVAGRMHERIVRSGGIERTHFRVSEQTLGIRFGIAGERRHAQAMRAVG
jgi:hypothetical protein